MRERSRDVSLGSWRHHNRLSIEWLCCGKTMGLDLTYKAGDHHFSIRFSMADWQTIEQLEQHLPAAVAACFNVQQFGEPVLVPLATLRESVAQIDSLLAEYPELLPYTYQFKTEYMQMGDKRIVLDKG